MPRKQQIPPLLIHWNGLDTERYRILKDLERQKVPATAGGSVDALLWWLFVKLNILLSFNNQ